MPEMKSETWPLTLMFFHGNIILTTAIAQIFHENFERSLYF